MKKIFGYLNITWPRLIVFAILAGVYTAIMTIIPALRYTSFISITSTFEVWIFIGILLIVNSKSNKDAALKCFIFFLISQPLVYLLQVPFSWQGWNLFGYYKYWFMWTLLCLPMGYIGYYMKKNKWWGYLILFPMILLTAYSYMTYLSYFTFSYPKYLLISLFCIAAMIIYPLYIFDNKKIKITGVVISSLLVVLISIFVFMNPVQYNTDILISNNVNVFDDTYKVYLKDNKYGSVKIVNTSEKDVYMIHADFIKEGKTNMIIESSDGVKVEYSLDIKRDTYKLTKLDKN